VQLVFSVVVMYHLTVFQLSKWALKKIDRIRCRFLWHGVDNVHHDHGARLEKGNTTQAVGRSRHHGPRMLQHDTTPTVALVAGRTVGSHGRGLQPAPTKSEIALF
jgi:hypothetical protein